MKEVIFEYQQVGKITKISAIDVASGIEVVIQCPSHYSEFVMQQNALKKLEKAIRKNSNDYFA